VAVKEKKKNIITKNKIKKTVKGCFYKRGSGVVVGGDHRIYLLCNKIASESTVIAPMTEGCARVDPGHRRHLHALIESTQA